MSVGCSRAPIAKHNIERTNAMPSPNRIPVGTKFSRLLVLRSGLFKTESSGKTVPSSLCRCDCGRAKIIRNDCLRAGRSKACGMKGCCYRNTPATHGYSRTKIYHVWSSMIRRCENPRNKRFNCYGGRGIRVCRRWKKSFVNFLTDMGPKPTPKHSVHRIDNDGDYKPSNCKWATQKEQTRNTQRSKIINHDGKSLTLIEWCELTGINRGAMNVRLELGWPLEKVFNTPIKNSVRRNWDRLSVFATRRGFKLDTLQRYFYREKRAGLSDTDAIQAVISKCRK